ncbi:MAG: hypothetical protein R8L53_07430 [Mariprofundales bacterium]
MSEPSLDEILSSIDDLLRDTNLDLPSRSGSASQDYSKSSQSIVSKSAHTDTVAKVTDSYDLLADVEATLHKLDVGISDMFSNTSTRATELQTMDLTDSSISSNNSSPPVVAEKKSTPKAKPETPELFLSTLQDNANVGKAESDDDVYQDLLGFGDAEAAAKKATSSEDSVDKTIVAQPDLTPAEVIANNILAAKEAQVGTGTIAYQTQKTDENIYEIGDLDLGIAEDDAKDDKKVEQKNTDENNTISDMGDEFATDTNAFEDVEVNIPKSDSFNSLLKDSQPETQYKEQNVDEAHKAAEFAMAQQMAEASKIAKQSSMESTQEIDAQQGFDAESLFDLSSSSSEIATEEKELVSSNLSAEMTEVNYNAKPEAKPDTKPKAKPHPEAKSVVKQKPDAGSSSQESKASPFSETQRRHPAIRRDHLLTDEDKSAPSSKDIAQQLRFELTTEMMTTDVNKSQQSNANTVPHVSAVQNDINNTLTNTQLRSLARAIVHESLGQLEEDLWMRIEKRLDSLLHEAINEKR